MRKGKIISLATRGLSSQWRSFLVVLAGAAVLAFAAPQQEQKQAELLLIEAINKELVEGDLQQALELYKQVISKFSSERPVVARALLRLGEGYEKLGNPEAREAYERLLREYADQVEQAAVARTRLAALEEPPTPGEPSGVVVRQVWSGLTVDAMSPDGRYLIVSSGGGLEVHDLRTRQNWRLGEEARSAYFAVISPSGQQVVYVSDLVGGRRSELRVVRLDGTQRRVLVSHEEVPYPQPFAWSPDGTQILAAFARKDTTSQIVLVSAADGSARLLKSLEWRPFPDGLMSFSPDGRYIAYDAPTRQGSPQHDIYLLATDGSRETPLIEHAANDLFAGWAPDGNRVLFVSNRTGTWDLWTIPVTDGRPQGSAELVRRNVGRIRPIGFVRNGGYYYELNTRMEDVYIASLDPATGNVVESPTLASVGFRGGNTAPDWSPDGQYLAYLSRVERSLPYDTLGFGVVIVVRSLQTGEERELSPPLDFLTDTRLRWAPDGRSFLISAQDRDRRRGLYQVDAQTGDVTPIVVSPPKALSVWQENRWHAAWSHDGTAIFYVRDDGEGCEIRVRDLKTGQEKSLYRAASASHLANVGLSPDGRWLAFSSSGTHYAALAQVLLVMPAAGGTPRELLRLPDAQITYSLAWAQDGRHLLFSRHVQEPSRPTELWRVSVETGEAQRVGLPMVGRGDVRAHPDGRRIAFTNWTRTPAGGLWVMENVLPELSSTK